LFLFSASCSTAPWTFSGPGIGFRSLTTARQPCPVSSPSVAPKVSKSLYVHRDLSTKVTFDNEFVLDDFADAVNIVGIQIITVHRVGKVNFIKNTPCRG
jgi:hypothetical protein